MFKSSEVLYEILNGLSLIKIRSPQTWSVFAKRRKIGHNPLNFCSSYMSESETCLPICDNSQFLSPVHGVQNRFSWRFNKFVSDSRTGKEPEWLELKELLKEIRLMVSQVHTCIRFYFGATVICLNAKASSVSD